MNLTDQASICPYTGLRSFTEEESIYFKGRDLQVDQITDLLSKNKFLMVTGASGEGKSSLVYAGLIPNARAGFFKSKYTNWLVADFRPERSPLKNMAKSLAEKFSYPAQTVETELRRGFASLVDLYTNSDFYIDEKDTQWQQLNEQDKKAKKRNAANLLILTDQFEEFFTNPENFSGEGPSHESQVVVNLILETARIALQNDLPIYVACTMRADFIGQCTSFRGLPEYIGFSQFFVPRLKRKDLKQTIEEPAILSGNRVSQRLIERIVYDLSEGIDQLPILQHVMSQIWLVADHGREEMDLIHYAMVGGMPASELPDDDQVRFANWHETLPIFRQIYFQNTGLNKVIEIHANTLYEQACSYFNERHPEKPITIAEAKRIIALTFSCLTRIDNSRAVRNRMTLEEITGIINNPDLPAKVVGTVLNIFREEGNSFVRPFITAEESSKALLPDTVLDITHESLIRNWNKLNKWALEEFGFYTTFEDLKKQLDRWKDSGKNSDFLLPIGPLSYFENWYSKCRPNAHWIKRYAKIKENKDEMLADAAVVLSDIKEFLKRSARKEAISRAFMKYGAQRIAVFFAIIVMLALSSFYWYDADQKKNTRILNSVRKEAQLLLLSKEVDNDTKALHLMAEERHEKGYILSYLRKANVKERINLGIDLYKLLLEFDKKTNLPLKDTLIQFIQTGVTRFKSEKAEREFVIPVINRFVTLLAFDNYYNPNPSTEKLLTTLTERGYDETIDFLTLEKPSFKFTFPHEINYALQLWLTFGGVTEEKVHAILDLISPLNGDEASSRYNTYYPRGSFEPNGRLPNDYNGGPHMMASLYAAIGDVENVVRFFDQLKQTNQNDYFTGRLFNNYNNILGYLYQFGHQEKAHRLVRWLSTNYVTNTPLTIYRNTMIRSGYLSRYFLTNIEKNIFRQHHGYIHPNLFMMSRAANGLIGKDYEKIILEIRNPQEHHFQMAQQLKRKAIFHHKYCFDRGLPQDIELLESWLEQAYQHYQTIDKKYLQEEVNVSIPYYSDGIRTPQMTRKQLFIYPDYLDGWFSLTYHSDLFFNFLVKRGLLANLYETSNDLESLHYWIAKYYELPLLARELAFFNYYPLSNETLTRILDFADKHPQGKSFDRNVLNLTLANRAFRRGDAIAGVQYYHRINKEGIERSANRYEYLEKTFFLNQIKELCRNLSVNELHEEAVQLTELSQSDAEKAISYIYMADGLFTRDADPKSFIYLDSAFSKFRKIDFTTVYENIDPRYNLMEILGYIGSQKIENIASNILQEIPEGGRKFEAVMRKVYGAALEGNYYRSLTSIPTTLTESQDILCRTAILIAESARREMESGSLEWQPMTDFITYEWNYIFYQPF